MARAENETTIVRCASVASIAAMQSAASSLGAYASASWGRSERPLPRPSTTSTRKWRDR